MKQRSVWCMEIGEKEDIVCKGRGIHNKHYLSKIKLCTCYISFFVKFFFTDYPDFLIPLPTFDFTFVFIIHH